LLSFKVWYNKGNP